MAATLKNRSNLEPSSCSSKVVSWLVKNPLRKIAPTNMNIVHHTISEKREMFLDKLFRIRPIFAEISTYQLHWPRRCLHIWNDSDKLITNSTSTKWRQHSPNSCNGTRRQIQGKHISLPRCLCGITVLILIYHPHPRVLQYFTASHHEKVHGTLDNHER